MMDSRLEDSVNTMLENADWGALDILFLNHKEFLGLDSDFAYFYLIFQIERAVYGNIPNTALIRSGRMFSDTIRLIKDFKSMLVRYDWTTTISLGDVLSAAKENGISEKELLLLLKYFTRSPDKVYGRVKSELWDKPVYPEGVSAYHLSEQQKPTLIRGNSPGRGYDNVIIAFIACVNDQDEFEECRWYINQLEIPDGCSIELLEIRDADSMCSGYNDGMQYAESIGAKIKVYIHQDVYILNKYFLYELLKRFADPSVGMIGMVGSREVPDSGIMWEAPQFGNIVESRINRTLFYQTDGILKKYSGKEDIEAALVDGCCLATQYDIAWREDLFDGWHFYDASQSMEFRKKGYRIIIPYMEVPWIYHNCELVSMDNYSKYRNIFAENYIMAFGNE